MTEQSITKSLMKNGIRLSLIAAFLVCFIFTDISFAEGTVIGNDYPYKDDAYADSKGNHYADKWGFYKRECVSFAAWCLNSRNGLSFKNNYNGKKFGNASRWGTVASSLGIPVDSSPAVGSIAWRKSGNHVAWVAKVDGNNVTVEEYEGCGGDHGYHTRTKSKSYYDGFIHFKDITSSESPTNSEQEKPVIQDIRVDDKSMDGYTVSCKVEGSVTSVEFPTWTIYNDQDDLKWHSGYYRDGRWHCWISSSQHNNEEGNYVTDVYAKYSGGSVFGSERMRVFIDKTAPAISDIRIDNIDRNGYDISCVVKDNDKVSYVKVTSWAQDNNQGSFKWEDAYFSDGRWHHHVNVSDYNYTEGKYVSDFYAYDDCDNCADSQGSCPDIYIDRTAPRISDVRVTNIMENGYDISCVVEDYSIKSVEFVVRTSEMEYLVWNGEYENERYHCHLDLSGVYSQGNIYENAIRATDKFENEQGLYIGTVNISEADELNSDIGGGQDDVEKKEENDNRGDDHSDGECINNNDCNRNNEDETNNSLSDNAADSISGNDVIDSDNEDGSNDNSIVDDRDNNSNENESYNGLSDEERHGYISKTIHYQGFSDESVSMNITVNGTVSYNGKKHVSSLDGSGKTKSGDLDITVSGNVPENLEVVFKYKNNKSVSGKTPYLYIKLKGYGLDKEEKKWLKAVNKMLKRPENRVEFKINPCNITGQPIRVCTYEDLDGNMMIRKVTVEVDGYNIKMNKKDYGAEIRKDKIIITGRRNFTGSSYVVLR